MSFYMTTGTPEGHSPLPATTKFVRLVVAVALAEENAQRSEQAMTHYIGDLEADDLVEAFYLGLMRSYRSLGRHAEAMNAFRRLRQLLSVVLGIAPSEPTQPMARAAARQSGAVRVLLTHHRVLGLPIIGSDIPWGGVMARKASQLAKLTRPRLHMAVARGLVTGAHGHVTGEASRLRAVRHSPALCSMLLGNSRVGGAAGRLWGVRDSLAVRPIGGTAA